LASQEIKSIGRSQEQGPRKKELGKEGCGKRMSEELIRAK
jgi:hypothetical protein